MEMPDAFCNHSPEKWAVEATMSFHLLQLSEQDKLSLVGRPIFKVIGSLVVATIFWGLQEMAEIGFQCPWLDVYNVVYGVSFLVVPAVVLSLLSVFLHRECLMSCRCPGWGSTKCAQQHQPLSPDPRRHRSGSWKLIALLKIFYHGWMWIIVILLDGDCYACIHYFVRLPPSQGVKGANSGTSRSPDPPKDDSELIRVLKFESRVIGLALLLALVAIAVCVSCCHVSRCCGKPYYWWEYQQMYLEETERLVLSNLKESASRRAESNYINKTSTAEDGAEDAWEHISSAGFAKLEYPDDFRPAKDEGARDDDAREAALKDGSEASDQSGTCSEREEDGVQGKGEATAPTDDAHGINGQAGQAGGATPPGQEEAGKSGWKSRLRDHLQGIRQSLHRTVGSALKRHRVKGTG